jgi:hypothetical protein
VYCVYLLAAGGRIAYAGSSGRVEYRLRRHFRGYSSAAGPAPPTSWRAQGASRWRPHGRRGYTKPTGRPTPRRPPPRGRGSLPSPPGGTSPTPRSVSLPARRRPCGHERPPPKLKPRAKTWDEVRDGGLNSQKTSVARIRLGDLDLSGCRPVSLCL